MQPGRASRTAMRVALRRAAHQLVDAEPLVFRDPFALPILGDTATEELRRTPPAARRPFSSALRAWVVVRARFAEDVLAHTAAEGKSLQYLVLGAGLDTFALRNPYPGVQVFEVDHPATQAWKQNRLTEGRLVLPPSATLVPVDFETTSLLPRLLEAGFAPELPTVVAWLGVVPYLTLEAFAATCSVLGSLAPGSSVVFDYSQPREVLPPVEQLMHDSLAARVAQAGEPFQLFFTPTTLRDALRQHGITVSEDLGGAALNERYLAGRQDGLVLRGAAGRMCHACVLP